MAVRVLKGVEVGLLREGCRLEACEVWVDQVAPA